MAKDDKAPLEMRVHNAPHWTLHKPRRSWWMGRGGPVTIQSVTNKEVLAEVILTHEEAEKFVVHWIELNGTPGALIVSPFTSDNE